MFEIRRRSGRTAQELVRSGEVTGAQVYRAAVILERLQDRGAARHLTLEEMCEVLGYCGSNQRPARQDVRPRGARLGRVRELIAPLLQKRPLHGLIEGPRKRLRLLRPLGRFRPEG